MESTVVSVAEKTDREKSSTSRKGVVKTALNIDRDLVDQAAAVLGTEGTTATIEAALVDVVKRAARERLYDRLLRMTDEQREAILRAWD